MRYFGARCAATLLTAALLATSANVYALPGSKPFAATKSVDKNNSKLPVEISSDSLEVLQAENKAIFKGNVVAVQGQMRLKSDRMIVHYRQDDKSAEAKKPAPPAPAAAPATGVPGSMGAVTLIEVEGNVLMATPEESASGDRGNYEVDKKLLHLFGDNVVLTRGQNILRGTALEYNMETGRSVLSNSGDKPSSINRGRVRGVFVPNSDPKPAEKPAQKSAGKPADDPADSAGQPAAPTPGGPQP